MAMNGETDDERSRLREARFGGQARLRENASVGKPFA
jgi:hypothetical protein